MTAAATATRDLNGREVLITGANTGIGRTTALALAARGARVTIAGRSEARTRPVLEEIARLPGAVPPRFLALDLGDLGSVREAAARWRAVASPLHVLINNAGVAGARGLSPDGFEQTFAVNHLGHFLLTKLLLERLRASAPARVVNVSSRAHEGARGIDFEALRRPTATLTGMREYRTSKLCNVLFTKELARRLAGSGVTAYALHPGVVASDIWRRVPTPLRFALKAFMISNEAGAETTIYCATAPELIARSGGYFARSRERRPSRVAEDLALARRLWEQSETWTDGAR